MTGKNLKIPSRWLKITGGPYKGYEAEYKDRLRKGEFLVVTIGATGNEATIPIQNITFIMDDGVALKYDSSYKLVEIGKENNGQIIKITEDVSSPSRRNSVFFPSENLDDMIITDTDIISESGDVDDYGDEHEDIITEKKKSEEPNPYLETYEEKLQVMRNDPEEKVSETYKNISSIFQILGLNMDASEHSKSLELIFKNDFFDGMDLGNQEVLKPFIVAYVFIQINNMDLGYPVIIPGVAFTPNDDPGFIVSALYKTGFLTEKTNLAPYISALLGFLNTSIIPSGSSNNGLNNLSQRFGLLRLSKNKNTKVNTTLKVMRFPIYKNTVAKTQNEIKVKSKIFEKISKKLEDTNVPTADKQLLSGLIGNFDVYLKGKVFTTLKDNPDSIQTKTLLPYIEEYKELLECEEDIFYKKINKKPVVSTVKVSKKVNYKKIAVENMKSFIKQAMKNDNDVKKNLIRQSFIQTMDQISKMTTDEARKLKISTKTMTDEDKSYTNSIIGMKAQIDKEVNNVKRKFETKETEVIKKKIKEEMLSSKLAGISISGKPRVSLEIFKKK